jgi:CRP-like cAMP-binding protein
LRRIHSFGPHRPSTAASLPLIHSLRRLAVGTGWRTNANHCCLQCIVVVVVVASLREPYREIQERPMASDTFVGPLLRLPLFQGLTQPQLALIARRAERVMFRIGQPIIKTGEAGDGAYLFIVGTGERRDIGRDGVIDVTTVETGSLVGEMSMLIDTEYSTTIVAKTAIRALKITRAALHAQMQQDPELAAHFVAKISARLHDFRDEMRRVEGIFHSEHEQQLQSGATTGGALTAQVA